MVAKDDGLLKLLLQHRHQLRQLLIGVRLAAVAHCWALPGRQSAARGPHPRCLYHLHTNTDKMDWRLLHPRSQHPPIRTKELRSAGNSPTHNTASACKTFRAAASAGLHWPCTSPTTANRTLLECILTDCLVAPDATAVDLLAGACRAGWLQMGATDTFCAWVSKQLACIATACDTVLLLKLQIIPTMEL